MKRNLVLLSILLGTSMIYAQSLSFELDSLDISKLSPGDKVDISIILTEISNPPANEIWGWQIYFKCNEAVMTWDGTPVDPYDGISYYNPDIPWPLGALQFSYVGGQMAWLGGDGGQAYTVGNTTLPVTLATFRFTYIGGTCDLTWTLTDKNMEGQIILGQTEVYYDYYFEKFPILNLNNGAIYVNIDK